MKAMILAAGRGERLRPLTDHQPKALTDVAGKALIEHWLEKCAAAGICEVVINLGWLGEAIRGRLGNGADRGLQIRYSEEGWPALDTGGGLFKALGLLGPEAFVVLNADVYADIALAPLTDLAVRLPEADLAHLLLVPVPGDCREGDFGLEQGRVVNAPKCLTFSGISILRPALLKNSAPGAFSVVPLIRAAADRGQVGGARFDGVWTDVGTPARLQELRTAIRQA